MLASTRHPLKISRATQGIDEKVETKITRRQLHNASGEIDTGHLRDHNVNALNGWRTQLLTSRALMQPDLLHETSAAVHQGDRRLCRRQPSPQTSSGCQPRIAGA